MGQLFERRIKFPTEILLDSSVGLISAHLTPLREKRVADEENSEYSLIGQRLKAIEEALWVNPNDTRVDRLVTSAVQTALDLNAQYFHSVSSSHELSQLASLFKNKRPDLLFSLRQAWQTISDREEKIIRKRILAVDIARRFDGAAFPQALSDLATDLTRHLSENEGVLLTNEHLVDYHAGQIQTLSYVARHGSTADLELVRRYLTEFFNHHPFDKLNPMTAVDCIRLFAQIQAEGRPDPALIGELLTTVVSQLRTTLSDYLENHGVQDIPEKVSLLISRIDNYFTWLKSGFDFKTWREFMANAGVKLDDFSEADFEPTNTAIFRHELALGQVHALLMDYGQFDEALAILPRFVNSHNALVAVHNSQGDALVLNNPGLSDQLLSTYFQAFGRHKYDSRDRHQKEFDDHFPYHCAIGIAINRGSLNELALTSEIKAAVRRSGYDFFEKVETFLSLPPESDWHKFGLELLAEAISESKEGLSPIDGEDKLTDLLRVLLFHQTHPSGRTI